MTIRAPKNSPRISCTVPDAYLLKISEKKNANRNMDSMNRIMFFLIGLPLMGV